jgi:hypothetical protein
VEAPANQPEHWVTYFDGSLKLGGGGAGVLFISPKGEQLKYVFQILFEVSNNEAEYEALLHGLCLAVSLGIKRLLIYEALLHGLAPILPVLLRLLVHDWYYVEFTARASLPYCQYYSVY